MRALLAPDAPGDSVQVEREREAWEREEQEEGRGGLPDPRRVKPRSVSRERWVETMVVVDSKLINYHGSENVEAYIFTIMNMVSPASQPASQHINITSDLSIYKS